MTHTCTFDRAALHARGIEVTSGTIDGGNCPTQLDAADTVVLSDLFGHEVYRSPRDGCAAFIDLLEAPTHFPHALVTQKTASTDRYSCGTGPVVALPHHSLQSSLSTPDTFAYTLPTTDGMQERCSIEKTNNGWLGNCLWKTVHRSRATRTMDLNLCHDLRDTPTDGLQTTWFVDVLDEISIDNGWMHDMARGAPSYTVIPILTGGATGQEFSTRWLPQYESGITCATNEPTTRTELFRALDRLVQSIDVHFHSSRESVQINGYELALVTAPTSPEITAAMRRDQLLGLIQIAPFLRLLPPHSYSIFMGSPAEIMALARENAPTCTAVVRRLFLEGHATDGVYCDAEHSVFALAHEVSTPLPVRPGRSTMLRLLEDHNFTVVHELGHVLQYHHPDLLERFEAMYRTYVAQSLDAIGMPAATQHTLRQLTAAMPGNGLTFAQQTWLDHLWNTTPLSEVVPNPYALANAKEFFATMIQYYTPWHALSAHGKMYDGFFIALDALATCGVPAFFDALERCYGNPELVEERTPSLSTLASALGIGVLLGTYPLGGVAAIESQTAIKTADLAERHRTDLRATYRERICQLCNTPTDNAMTAEPRLSAPDGTDFFIGGLLNGGENTWHNLLDLVLTQIPTMVASHDNPHDPIHVRAEALHVYAYQTIIDEIINQITFCPNDTIREQLVKTAEH